MVSVPFHEIVKLCPCIQPDTPDDAKFLCEVQEEELTAAQIEEAWSKGYLERLDKALGALNDKRYEMMMKNNILTSRVAQLEAELAEAQSTIDEYAK